MSGLELNKIAAAVLVAGLTAMVVGKTTSLLYSPDTKVEKRGYSIAVSEDAGADTGKPKATGPVDITALLADATKEKGEGLTKPCVTCHSFEKGGPHKVGPNLWGVVGNHKAHAEGFAFSKAIQDRSSEKWGFQELSEFLTKPAAYVPGTKMAFAGIKKPEDRAAVIVYLNAMSDSPLPIPTAPAAADAAPKEAAKP